MAGRADLFASESGKAFEVMGWKTGFAGLLAMAVLSACSTTGGSSGSVVRAFAEDSRPSEKPVAAAIVDAMGGGLIGGQIGTNLDQRERLRALEAEYKALEYTPAGQAVAWGKEGGRRFGEVVAGSPYRVGSQDCRQYVHTVSVGGQASSARGTACRNPNGSWTPLA